MSVVQESVLFALLIIFPALLVSEPPPQQQYGSQQQENRPQQQYAVPQQENSLQQQQYGAPQENSLQQQQYGAPQQENRPKQNYGPPGHVAGQPLGIDGGSNGVSGEYGGGEQDYNGGNFGGGIFSAESGEQYRGAGGNSGEGSSGEYGAPQGEGSQEVGGRGQYGVGGGSCLNTDLNANKLMVMNFYQDVFGDKKVNLLEKYIAPNLINHNPMTANGIDGLRQALAGPFGQGPPMKIEFMRVAADGELVWTHVKLPVPAIGMTFAAVDIFRINCQGLIEEHWDVLQDINVQATNPAPFF